MKIKSVIVLVVTLSIFTVFTSCSYRIVDFTIVSSKNVYLGNIDKTAQRVVGKHTTINPTNAVKEAIDKAIEKAGSEYDALVDGVVKVSSYYCIFFYIYVYKVEGTPIKTLQLKADLGEKEFENWCQTHDLIYKTDKL